MVITGSLDVTIASARIRRPASDPTEVCAVVRCGKQHFATPKIRDNLTWNKSFTFSLEEESKTQDVLIEVLKVKPIANELIGSTRIPLSEAVERKMGASTYTLFRPNQTSCGDVNVAFKFSSSARRGLKQTTSVPLAGVSTATANKSQPPKGYPQPNKSPQDIENIPDEKLGRTELKERGLHSFFEHRLHGWAPGQYHYGHHSGAYSCPHYVYPPPDPVIACGCAPDPYPPACSAACQAPYGHGAEYYEGSLSHGHYGYQMGPPFYPSQCDYGYHHNHMHHHC